MEGERVPKTMRAGRRRPDLLDNEAEAVALVEPMDEAIIAKKILQRMVSRLLSHILSPYDMYKHLPQVSNLACGSGELWILHADRYANPSPLIF